MRPSTQRKVLVECKDCKGEKCEKCKGRGIIEYEKKSFRDHVIEKSSGDPN